MSDYGAPKHSALDVFFFPLLTVALVVGVWFLAKAYILKACFYVSFFMFMGYEHLGWLMTDSELQTIKAARHAIPSIIPSKHGFSSFMMLAEYHGYILRWLAIPAMFYLGWRAMKGTVRFKYRKGVKDVYELIEIQAKHFPASAIIYKQDILKQDMYTGPWATFALPLDFALMHKLLWTSNKRVKLEDGVDEKAMTPIPPFSSEIRKIPFAEKRELIPGHEYVALSLPRTNKLFSDQLGPLWTGHDSLPPLEKALFAILCAQANEDLKSAWAMICQIAFSFKHSTWQGDKLITPAYADTSGVDELLKKYASTPVIKKITALHAHKNNVFASVLTRARKNGRLYHSNILWMKTVNRTLWYTLCSNGGQVPYWEAAGPWAHAQVEQRMGRKLAKPMVAGAVDQMLNTMQREHWIDPGIYSEAYQRKLVQEANELLEQELAKGRNEKSGFVPPARKRTGGEDSFV
jgi:hypothetical protein